MSKIQTIDLKGKAYATVPTRIKEFRQDCPNGDIKTEPIINGDGTIMFKTTILKDKSNPNSASSTGHAIGQIKGEKAFEKLETISVGRALALLGYMASGEVASSEEMEEFEMYKQTLKENAIEELQASSSQETLKAVWGRLTGNLKSDKDIIKVKDELKAKLK